MESASVMFFEMVYATSKLNPEEKRLVTRDYME